MQKKPYPSETQERFIVRLPDGMRDRIAEEAKKNNRSMNAEIVGRLEYSLANPPMSDDDQKEILEKLNRIEAFLIEREKEQKNDK